MEKLQSLNEKNAEAAEDAKGTEKVISELEEKLSEFERGNEVKYEVIGEDIRKEQYLKQQNMEMFNNLKAAIDNSTKIYSAENEKLIQVKSQVSSLEIDVGQIERQKKELIASIRNYKEQLENSVSWEKLSEILCAKCMAKVKGISIMMSVNEIRQSVKRENSSCSKCIMI
jgi:chromosome segregation ATPase